MTCFACCARRHIVFHLGTRRFVRGLPHRCLQPYSLFLTIPTIPPMGVTGLCFAGITDAITGQLLPSLTCVCASRVSGVSVFVLPCPWEHYSLSGTPTGLGITQVLSHFFPHFVSFWGFPFVFLAKFCASTFNARLCFLCALVLPDAWILLSLSLLPRPVLPLRTFRQCLSC